jgi:hypothetical protein
MKTKQVLTIADHAFHIFIATKNLAEEWDDFKCDYPSPEDRRRVQQEVEKLVKQHLEKLK